MKAPIKSILVLICCLACLNGCLHYYRIPVAQPAGMSQEDFNAQLGELKKRVQAIEGVKEVRLASEVPGTIKITLIHNGDSPTLLKSQVKAILNELGLGSETVSVVITSDI